MAWSMRLKRYCVLVFLALSIYALHGGNSVYAQQGTSSPATASDNTSAPDQPDPLKKLFNSIKGLANDITRKIAPPDPNAKGVLRVDVKSGRIFRSIRITARSDSEAGRRIFNMVSGKAEQIPVGHYAVEISAHHFAPQIPSEVREVDIEADKLSVISLDLNTAFSRLADLIVAIENEAGAPLSKAYVGLSGPGMATPIEPAPAERDWYLASVGSNIFSYKLLPGDYQITVPGFSENGIQYAARTETVTLRDQIKRIVIRPAKASETAAPQVPATGKLTVIPELPGDKSNSVNDVTVIATAIPQGVAYYPKPFWEQELPAGRYSVYGYIDVYEGSEGNFEKHGYEAKTEVEIRPGQPIEAKLVLGRASRPQISVAVIDSTAGTALTGVPVSLSGQENQGPLPAPAQFLANPGQYRVSAPAFSVNGQNYRAREIGVTLQSTPVSVILALEHADAGPSQQPAVSQASSIRFDSSLPDMNKGDGYGLAARVYDASGQEIPDAPIVWSSGAPEVATVDASGYVTAVGRGSGRIVARSGAAAASLSVTVASGAMAGNCRISNNPVHLPSHGGTHTFQAEAWDTDGKPWPNASFAWSGSNDSIAVIQRKTGRLVTERPGRLTVFAELALAAGRQINCSADVVVDPRYQDVLVSGRVVDERGHPVAGAAIQAANGPAVRSEANGSFTTLAGSGPHAEGASVSVSASLKGNSTSAAGRVLNGAVNDVVIVMRASGTPVASKPAGPSAEQIAAWQRDLDCLREGKRKYPNIELNCNGNFLLGSRDNQIKDLETRLRNAGVDPGGSPAAPAAAPHPAGNTQAGSTEHTLPVSLAGGLIAWEMALGDVRWYLSAPSEAMPLHPGDKLESGSTLQTGKNSRVSIKFPDQASVSVGEQSKVKVMMSSKPAPRLEVSGGSVEITDEPRAAASRNRNEGAPSFDRLEVSTPHVVIRPTGTRYRVQVSNRGTAIDVLEGAVRLSGALLARTNANFAIVGKMSFQTTLDLKAGDKGFAFDTMLDARWTDDDDALSPTAPESPLARPDPWNAPEVQRLIDEWLRSAKPTVSPELPGPWRFTEWGQAVGPGSRVTGIPDHPAGWSRYQSLWARRTQFESLNLCTMGEYIERRIAGKRLDGCERALPKPVAAPQQQPANIPVPVTTQPAASRPAQRPLLDKIDAIPDNYWIAGKPDINASGFRQLLVLIAEVFDPRLPYCGKYAQDKGISVAGFTSRTDIEYAKWGLPPFPIAVGPQARNAVYSIEEATGRKPILVPIPLGYAYLLDRDGRIIDNGPCEQVVSRIVGHDIGIPGGRR